VTKVVRVEILRKIGEGLQDRESGDHNTDRKIQPNLEIHMYCIYIHNMHMKQHNLVGKKTSNNSKITLKN
jgi:hypothetical protein